MHNKVYELIAELYLDLILGNNPYEKSVFAGVNRSVIEFINFIGRTLNSRGPTNMDIS